MKVHIGPYRKNRKVSIRIDNYDTWSMDDTLALIILPMLKQLKETKHGSPYTDNEDVPEELWNRNIDEYEDDTVHIRWDYVLDEMIWAFNEIVNQENENKYFDDDGNLLDIDEYRKYLNRIKNGTALFGKYYQALWD